VSQYLPGTAAAMGGCVAVVVLETVGVSGVVVGVGGIAAAIVAMALWLRSPLPNHNGPAM